MAHCDAETEVTISAATNLILRNEFRISAICEDGKPRILPSSPLKYQLNHNIKFI
jgi:hypothetical protein